MKIYYIIYIFKIARLITNMTNYHYTEFKVKLYPNVFDVTSIGGDGHVNGVEVSIIGVCLATEVAYKTKQNKTKQNKTNFKI